MNISDFLAKLTSFLLQPLLMPLYNVSLLFFYTNFYDIYQGQFFRFIIPVFIFSFFMPGLFIVVLKKLLLIKDYALTDRRDRILPCLMTCFSNAVLFYYFFQSGSVYIWFLGLLAAPVVISIFAFFANFFMRISYHMLGIGGLIGSLISVSIHVKATNPFVLLSVLLILAGCLAVSRLYLRKAAQPQIYISFITGCLLAYLCILVSTMYIY